MANPNITASITRTRTMDEREITSFVISSIHECNPEDTPATNDNNVNAGKMTSLIGSFTTDSGSTTRAGFRHPRHLSSLFVTYQK
jgi:hypothetical protein